jgi:hypothetical protein
MGAGRSNATVPCKCTVSSRTIVQGSKYLYAKYDCDACSTFTRSCYVSFVVSSSALGVSRLLTVGVSRQISFYVAIILLLGH